MARVTVERTYGPARRLVIKELQKHIRGAVGRVDYKPLAITVRERGQIVGGLVARMFLGWLFIELLWVSDQRRQRGLGRSLMQKAESEARKRGIRNAYLDTFSFQAPGFYKKLGYREFGKLKNFPAGHTRHWMTKAL
jgi:ribosomal protein S18 acetylase RimI-like enzyme